MCRRVLTWGCVQGRGSEGGVWQGLGGCARGGGLAGVRVRLGTHVCMCVGACKCVGACESGHVYIEESGSGCACVRVQVGACWGVRTCVQGCGSTQRVHACVQGCGSTQVCACVCNQWKLVRADVRACRHVGACRSVCVPVQGCGNVYVQV